MKKTILVLILTFLFLSCTKQPPQFNYIVASVAGWVKVLKFDESSSEWKLVDGEGVEMALIKAGGETVDGIGITYGGETTITAVFNLYKDQPIEFKAKLVNHPAVSGYSILEWDTVDFLAKPLGPNEPRAYSHKLAFVLRIPIE